MDDVAGDVGEPCDAVGQFLKYIYPCIEISVALVFGSHLLLTGNSSGFVLSSGPGTPYLQDPKDAACFVYLVAYAGSWIPLINEALGEANLVLIRNLGPMLGMLQNRAIRGVLSSFVACLPGIYTVMVPITFLIIFSCVVGMELFGGRLIP